MKLNNQIIISYSLNLPSWLCTLFQTFNVMVIGWSPKRPTNSMIGQYFP
jgi:hypothetical protein